MAREGSHEDLLHWTGLPASVVMLGIPEVTDGQLGTAGQRAIGVAYNPAYERYGNYVRTVLPLRYDALLYLERTTALHPLQVEALNLAEVPETYPFTT